MFKNLLSSNVFPRPRRPEARFNLSRAYHSLGKKEKAIEFSQLGLTIAKKTENKDLLGRGYNILGNVSFSLGDFENAIEFYKLGLTIAKETGDKHLEGH